MTDKSFSIDVLFRQIRRTWKAVELLSEKLDNGNVLDVIPMLRV